MIRRIALALAFVAAANTVVFALSASSIPTKIPTYWGTSAPGGNITCPIPIPSQIGITNGRASWTDGFPPLTFSPVASGGIPPFGQDFNGVFCQLSQWTRWYNAGGTVPYDSVFQAAIGGYPNGAIIASVAFPGAYWLSTADNNTSNPDTGGANWSVYPRPAWGSTGSGSANAQTVTLPNTTTLANLVGVRFSYIPAATNTGPTTLAVSGFTAKSVLKNGVGGLVALAGQEIISGSLADLVYDGTEFVLLNPNVGVYTQFYVSPTGTDSGNCTISSSPCQTLNYVTAQALASNAGGNVQQINLAAGGWNETVNVQGFSAGGAATGHNNMLVFVGAGRASTTWNGSSGQCGTLIANAGANIGIQNLTIEGDGNVCQSALYAQLGGLIQVYASVAFGTTNYCHMFAEGSGSQILIWNSYFVNSGSYSAVGHMCTSTNAIIEINPVGITVNLGSGITYQDFLLATINSSIYLGAPITFVGGFGGRSYLATLNSVIFSDGQGCSFIPGTTGVTNTGGICQ